MEQNVVNAPETEEGINLAELFSALLSKLLWLILAAAVCGGGAFIYGKMTETPVYNSTVTVYVINDKMESSGDVTIATYYAQDYAKLITKRPVLERAIANVGVDMTYAQLLSSIEITIEEQSRVLDIKVKNSDPEMAQKLADGVAIAAKEMMEERIGDERAVLWGTAELPKSPAPSSVLRTAILAALAGLVLSSAIVIAIYLYDDKLRSAEGVEKALGLTVLASIPEELEEDKKNHLLGGNEGKENK